MRYLSRPLGNVGRGAVVDVTLSGVESDVFLVDDPNLARFKRGQSFSYAGGHYRQSPVRLGVPSSGRWTVVVVPNGGAVRVSVRLLAA